MPWTTPTPITPRSTRPGTWPASPPGQKTETNRLGYVAAFPSAQGISAFTAYYLGAKSVNDQVTMVVRYTNAWSDAEQETQLAQGLIDLGCDVLSYNTNTAATAEAARPTGSLWWAATRTSPRWPQTPP